MFITNILQNYKNKNKNKPNCKDIKTIKFSEQTNQEQKINFKFKTFLLNFLVFSHFFLFLLNF